MFCGFGFLCRGSSAWIYIIIELKESLKSYREQLFIAVYLHMEMFCWYLWILIMLISFKSLNRWSVWAIWQIVKFEHGKIWGFFHGTYCRIRENWQLWVLLRTENLNVYLDCTSVHVEATALGIRFLIDHQCHLFLFCSPVKGDIILSSGISAKALWNTWVTWQVQFIHHAD